MPISLRQRQMQAIAQMVYRKFDRFYQEYQRERNSSRAKTASRVKAVTVNTIPNRLVYGLLQQNIKSVFALVDSDKIAKAELIVVKRKQDQLMGEARMMSDAEEQKVMRFLISLWSEAYTMLNSISKK